MFEWQNLWKFTDKAVFKLMPAPDKSIKPFKFMSSDDIVDNIAPSLWPNKYILLLSISLFSFKWL